MRFFSLPKIILFFASIFSRKNRENHGFWPPKTIPKPCQNAFKIDVPKNIDFFEVFCYSFCIFVILETLKISIFLGKTTIFKVFTKNVFLQFSCIFGPKNLPKTLPKRSPNPSKIDAENVMFFNIDFFGFRPRFWRVLGL